MFLISILFVIDMYAQGDMRYPIAVFPFEKEEEISKGEMEKFTEALRNQFIESERYELISFETFKEIMREKKLSHWEPVPDSLFEEIAKSLGVKLVVEGTMERMDDGGISINASLVDVTTKKEKIIEAISIPAGSKVELLASAIINSVFMQIDCDKYATFGLQYLKNKNFERAEENFLRVFHLDPTHVECYYYLGNTYLEMGDTVKAVDQYNNALSYNPDYADAYARLATVYQSQHDIEKAAESFSRLLEIEPENLSYRLNYASVLFQNERYQDALLQYEEALKIDSMSANVWMGMGLSYYKMEDWQEAITPLEKASEFNGSDVNNLVYLVSSYHKLNDYSGAASAYERIVALEPSHSKAYLNLGLFYQKLKKNKKAIEAFKMGTQHSPEEDKGELYLALANGLNKAERYGEAINAADQALKRGANVRRCHMIIGDAYQDLGESLESADTIEKYQEAITYYDKSINAYGNVVKDPKFGKYAKDNIERNKELIKRAELIIKKKELGGD
jgi:tetratricopeptide (TPR) repeat protein